MLAVIFKAEINELDEEYFATAKRMRELAEGKYGCIGFTSATEGALEISVSYWKNEHDIEKWRKDPEHLSAQTTGREKSYKSYSVEITEILRSTAKQAASKA
ncbi:MAG: antibiotic biosynthesis monooxygenase [Gammaproteobacteria bacterium]|nr:antibiotic biosynthesis monooxygenase [Gammaproteobacteria bacterium]